MTRVRLLSVAALAVVVTVLTPAFAAGPTGTASDPKGGTTRSWLKESGARDVSSAPVRGRSWGTVAAGIVLAALVGGALYRRRQLRRLAAEKRVSRIQILDTTRIGSKAQLVTALVGERVVVLGVTESQISTLTWLEPGETSALDLATARSDPGHGAATKCDVARKYESAPGAQEPSAGARFGGILRQAIGIAPARESHDDSAAVRLANRTQDVVHCSPEAALRASGAHAPRAIDVEGQAAGLVARLSKGQR